MSIEVLIEKLTELTPAQKWLLSITPILEKQNKNV